MKTRLIAKIKKPIADGLNRSIPSLIKDPDFFFEVADVRVRETASSIYSSRRHTLIVSLETNNRSLLLGQFVFFKDIHKRGFHIDYLTAKVEDIMEGIVGDSLADWDILFDICCAKHMQQLNYLYRPLDLKLAINLGLLDEDSLLSTKMREYSIDSVMLAGCEISGPNYGMIRVIEEICGKYSIKRSLDLFAGTCALSKVVLENSTCFAECVDVNESVSSSALKNYAGRYLFHNIDAFDFTPSKKYDLLILDPFYDHSLEVTQRLLPKYAKYARIAVVNLGLTEERCWINGIARDLKQQTDDVDFRRIGENSIAIVTFE